MPRMKHEHKVKIAKRGVSRGPKIDEIHKSIWDTKFWNDRKEAIKRRVAKLEQIAKDRAIERRAREAATK